jgi:hypothetical protein
VPSFNRGRTLSAASADGNGRLPWRVSNHEWCRNGLYFCAGESSSRRSMDEDSHVATSCARNETRKGASSTDISSATTRYLGVLVNVIEETVKIGAKISCNKRTDPRVSCPSNRDKSCWDLKQSKCSPTMLTKSFRTHMASKPLMCSWMLRHTSDTFISFNR